MESSAAARAPSAVPHPGRSLRGYRRVTGPGGNVLSRPSRPHRRWPWSELACRLPTAPARQPGASQRRSRPGGSAEPASAEARVAEIAARARNTFRHGSAARRPARRPGEDRGGQQPGGPGRRLSSSGALLPRPHATLAGPTFAEGLDATFRHNVGNLTRAIPRQHRAFARIIWSAAHRPCHIAGFFWRWRQRCTGTGPGASAGQAEGAAADPGR